MVLDDLDRGLLRLLREDARRSYRTLARLADSTVPTVSARIRRMEELGIIQGYTVRLDPARFGADHADHVDLSATVRVACHTCHRETADPLYATIGGRRHPFCCPTCRDSFRSKHERLAEGL